MIAIGTTTALGAAGLALGTEPAGAQASVEVGTLQTDDDDPITPADGAPHEVWLIVTGPWEFRTQTSAAEWEVFALIGDGGGNTETVTTTGGTVSGTEASGTYGLRAPVMDASHFEAADFAIPDGQDSLTVSVPLTIAFIVRSADGAMLVQDRAETTVPVVVEPGGTMAAIGGSVAIVGQDDAGDATPTPPGSGA